MPELNYTKTNLVCSYVPLSSWQTLVSCNNQTPIRIYVAFLVYRSGHKLRLGLEFQLCLLGELRYYGSTKVHILLCHLTLYLIGHLSHP